MTDQVIVFEAGEGVFMIGISEAMILKPVS
jgi:hypothetical protein